MTQRIGILANSLHDRFPRGVHRVARAVTEHLAAQVSDDVEFHCLTGRIHTPHEIFYDSYDLGDWLSDHPMRIVRSWQQRFLGVFRHWAHQLCPPALWPACRWALTLIRSLLTCFVNRCVTPLKTRLINRRSASRAETRKAKLPCPMGLNEFDAIVSFDPFDAIWGLPVENYRPHFICWFYDAIPRRINEGPNWNPDNFNIHVSRMALRAKSIVCDSASAEQDLLALFPAARGKTHVVALGHDLERFSDPVNDCQLEALLRRNHIHPAIPYLLFVGNVDRRKNIENIFRACQLLQRQHPDLPFQLVLVGRVSDQPNFGRLLAEMRKSFPVIVTNYLRDSDVAVLTRGARAFLFPSLWEGFGIPPLESMTAGTLLVTSDVSSLPDVCGSHALYCDPYDHSDIAQAIHRCLAMTSAERYGRLASARRHSAQFTWDKTGDSFLKILRTKLKTAQNGSSLDHPVAVPRFLRPCA